jgi:predicted amidohydrolase
MNDTIRVACIQFTSSSDKAANIDKAQSLVADAARRGAALALLPEHWNTAGDGAVLRDSAEEPDSGPTLTAMSDWARRFGIALVGGSIMERPVRSDEVFNTSFVFDRRGSLVGSYRKIHLFDVDVGGESYRESAVTDAGGDLALVDIDGWSVGLSICYDVRFPELYRALAVRGAELVVVPAYFTVVTGRDHWDLLVRSRAVENQLWIVAAGQCGEPVPGKPAYGRSLICDPWGIVVAQAGDDEGVIVADISRERTRRVRQTLPALSNRRPAVYASWLEKHR